MRESRLLEIQRRATERLRLDPALAGVPVGAARDASDAQARAEAEGVGGVQVWVFAPLPLFCIDNAPGPLVDEISLKVRVLAPSGAPAGPPEALPWAVAEAVTRSLHLWETGVAGVLYPVRLSPLNPWTLAAANESRRFTRVDVNFLTDLDFGV